MKTAQEVCREIAIDMQEDATRFDGQPFTGKTMAEYMGNHGAAIAALAKIIEGMLDSKPERETPAPETKT